jgi:hypothetical protein
MRAEQHSIIFADNPAPWWAIAVLFLAVGIGFIFFGIASQEHAAEWQHGLTMLVGVVGTGSGLVVAWNCPRSITLIDSQRQILAIVRTGLFGWRKQTIALDEVASVSIERQWDDQGNPAVRPVLFLRNGERIPLSALWMNNFDAIENAAARIRAVLAGAPQPQSTSHMTSQREHQAG